MADRVAVDQGDRPRGVPTEVDDLEGDLTERDRVAVPQASIGYDGQRVRVLLTCRGGSPGRAGDVRECPMVVPVPVGRHDRVEGAGALIHQGEDPAGLVRGIDQQLRTGAHAGEQIDVVRHGADAGLAEGQELQVTPVAGAASGHLADVLQLSHPVNGHNSPD